MPKAFCAVLSFASLSWVASRYLISAVEINFFGNIKSIIKMQLDNSEKIILMMLIIFEVLNQL